MREIDEKKVKIADSFLFSFFCVQIDSGIE